MKKYLIIAIIAALLALTGTFYINSARAEVGTVGGQSIWKLLNGVITPFVSTWKLGNSSNRISEGWFTLLNATSLTVAGTATGNLDMGGYNISNGGTFTSAIMVATSTTATSTFAGGVSVGSRGYGFADGSYQTTAASAGITSLNGLTGATQTFANDTNVTISSSGTTHTLGWSSVLSVLRGGTGQSSFGQGWLHTDGTTFTASTSPTVAWLTATSTTATSTFQGVLLANTAGSVGVSSSTPFTKLSLGSGAITTAAFTVSTSTSMTIDWRDGNQQTVRIGTAATTIAHTGFIPGQTLVLEVCNPGGTASTITYSGVLWPGGTAPTHTTTANKCDLDIFRAGNGTSTPIIYGGFNQNY